MDVVDRGRWDRPRPAAEADFGEYLRACAEGRLVIQRCPVCGHQQWYPRSICTACAATPGWQDVAGTGTVYTFTVIRQFHAAPFGSELPYAVAMVDLDDAPVRIFGTVTAPNVDALHIGLPVQAYAVKFDADHALPYWRPR